MVCDLSFFLSFCVMGDRRVCMFMWVLFGMVCVVMVLVVYSCVVVSGRISKAEAEREWEWMRKEMEGRGSSRVDNVE